MQSNSQVGETAVPDRHIHPFNKYLWLIKNDIKDDFFPLCVLLFSNYH